MFRVEVMTAVLAVTAVACTAASRRCPSAVTEQGQVPSVVGGAASVGVPQGTAIDAVKTETWRWISREQVASSRCIDDPSALVLALTEIRCESQSLIARVSLRNRSKSWLWVRSIATLGFAPSLVFNVKDAGSGMPIEYSAKGGGEASLTDYVSLGPDGEISKSATVLRTHLSDSTVRTWNISARYADERRVLPEPPEWLLWFSGELESNSVSVEVSVQGNELKCQAVTSK